MDDGAVCKVGSDIYYAHDIKLPPQKGNLKICFEVKEITKVFVSSLGNNVLRGHIAVTVKQFLT